ncbi:MAG: 3-deoxy-D-manno-octulosonic acid kinase [Steroidobacteraceae bacterium]
MADRRKMQTRAGGDSNSVCMACVAGAATRERWQVMQEQELRNRRAGILYDADLLRKSAVEPSAALFDVEHWRAAGALDIVPGGRASVAFIRRPQGDWVLRHYRRGGLVARIADDSYVWTGAARTRCFREWRLLAQLREWDLPVPMPIAARYRRVGPFYRADLLTAAIPQAATLARLVIEGRADDSSWSQVGATLARFHARGVHHADLNANNLLIDRTGAVFVLDFDRGRVDGRGSWEDHVLARLRRSLQKITAQHASAKFTGLDWNVLDAAYRQNLRVLTTP